MRQAILLLVFAHLLGCGASTPTPGSSQAVTTSQPIPQPKIVARPNNPLTIAAWLADPPPQGMLRFRLWVKLDDLYLGEFFDRQGDYFSLQAEEEPLGPFLQLYANKGIFRQTLFAALKDGERHKFTLNISRSDPAGRPLPVTSNRIAVVYTAVPGW